jgi:hypothetical protein
MGLTVHDVRMLVETGRRFTRVLMLGRQWLFATPRQLRQLGLSPNPDFRFGSFFDESGIAIQLGISDLIIADASDYEGAGLVHDLNAPLPSDYSNRFDLVIDGGTLEHVFNVPVAIGNCMRALQVGGMYFGTHPANNLMGHGFYQFGPEFYYRVFAPENGFKLITVELQESRYPSVEYGFVSRRYRVRDPQAARERVSLQSGRAAMLRVIAEKIGNQVPFGTWPQQTDYVPQWEGARDSERSNFVRALALKFLPSALIRQLVGWHHRRRARLSNRDHFERTF